MKLFKKIPISAWLISYTLVHISYLKNSNQNKIPYLVQSMRRRNASPSHRFQLLSPRTWKKRLSKLHVSYVLFIFKDSFPFNCIHFHLQTLTRKLVSFCVIAEKEVYWKGALTWNWNCKSFSWYMMFRSVTVGKNWSRGNKKICLSFFFHLCSKK